MKKCAIVIGVSIFLTGAVAAQDRAYTLDGQVIELGIDGTYQLVTGDNPPGTLTISITSGHSRGEKCELEANLQNNTDFTVQYLKQCIKAFSQRDSDTICFSFGGGRKSDRILPGSSSAASGKFKKGTCETITGAEPYFLFGGRDPSGINVDGIAPFDARKLIHFSSAGVIKFE